MQAMGGQKVLEIAGQNLAIYCQLGQQELSVAIGVVVRGTTGDSDGRLVSSDGLSVGATGVMVGATGDEVGGITGTDVLKRAPC